MSMHHESAHSSSRLRTLLTLAGLVLPTALLAGCDSDGLDGEPEAITLRPIEFEGPVPGFEVAISLAGEDVALDWSGSEGSAVSVFRSSDPALLASLPLGGTLPAGVVEVVLDPSATDYADADAADHDALTPIYYYRVGIESEGTRVLSRMVMKTTTGMAPGYNKFGLCMLEGPERASDVVARLGSSVVGVWGWDAVNQSYVSWTPAQGVGVDADFPIGFGGVFAAQVDGSTPSYQSLVGVVPTNEAFAVTGQPGYNWTTLPVGYSGPATASYWVDQVGYWGMGTWNNLTQNASWYWNSNYADFGLEACQPYYMYLPDNACTSNDDCGEDNFCYFVDPAACGDVAAGLCKAQPMGCEFAPQGDVCGCDDVTYASACEAEQAGASVASEGACEVVAGCFDQDVGSAVPVLEVMGDLNGQTDDYTPSCGDAGGPDYAYQFTAPADDSYQITVYTNGFEGAVDVVDGCDGESIACSVNSRFAVDLVAGQTVSIRVEGQNGMVGTTSLFIIGASTDECADDPCQNGGICTDTGFSYTCECPEGYNGYNCDYEIVEVPPAPCPCLDEAIEGGIYAFGAIGSAQGANACTTDPASISTEFNPFVGIPDTFFVNDDGLGGFTCGNVAFIDLGYITPLEITSEQAQACSDAIAGLAAELSLVCEGPAPTNPCDANPCIHGFCEGDPASENYECDCDTGWTGTNCDIESAVSCADVDLGDAVPQSVQGTLDGATEDYGLSCGAPDGADVTYEFTAAVAGTYVFDTEGTSDFDTLLSLFDTCGGSELSCNDDTVGLSSQLTMDLAAGQSVVVVVDSYGETTGSFTLNVELTAVAEICGDTACLQPAGSDSSCVQNGCNAGTETCELAYDESECTALSINHYCNAAGRCIETH